MMTLKAIVAVPFTADGVDYDPENEIEGELAWQAVKSGLAAWVTDPSVEDLKNIRPAMLDKLWPRES